MNENFSDLLVANLPRLRRFAKSLTGNAVDADDLAQQTLVSALSNEDKWTPGTRLDCWLYRIAQNLQITAHRRATVRYKHLQMVDPAQGTIQGGAESSNDLKAIAKFIRSLPTEQQSVVLLISVEGYSYAETADILGVALGTVTSRLSRARTSIRGFNND